MIPMGTNTQDAVHEPPRRTEIAGSYDVVVAGGGIAGAAAAVTAARAGLSTCLLEKCFAFGGLATLANVAVYLPLCDGRGVQLMAGIAEELLHLSVWDGFQEIPSDWRKNGPETDVLRPTLIREDDLEQWATRENCSRYQLTFNPSSFMLALDRWVTEAGVDILFDARVCGVDKRDTALNALIVETKSRRIAIKGRMFVDATGDADVAYFAGAPTVERATNVAAGWFYTVAPDRPIGDHRTETPEKRPDSGARLHKLSKPFDRFGRDPGHGEPTFTGCSGADLTRFSLESRRLIYERTVQYQGVVPLQLPSIPSVRMTRRIDGSYILTEQTSEVWPPNTVAAFGSWREPGPIYPLPLGALFTNEVPNLLAAGRCISSDGMLWDLTRAIPVCALTGEIAAILAGEAISSALPLADVTAERVRTVIHRNGGIGARPGG